MINTLLKYLPKKILLLFLGDASLISLAFFLSPDFAWRLLTWEPAYGLLITFVYLFTFFIADLYDIGGSFRDPKYAFRFTLAVIAAPSITWLILSLALDSGYAASFAGAGLVVIFTYSWRIVFEWWFKGNIRRPKRLLIVGAGWAGRTLYKTIKDNPDYKIVGFIDDDQCKWGPVRFP